MVNGLWVYDAFSNDQLKRRRESAGQGGASDDIESRFAEPGTQLVGFEAQPHMPLLAQAFVLVGHVIRDDEMPARPEKTRSGGDKIARAGDELQDAHDGHEIRATSLGDLLR